MTDVDNLRGQLAGIAAEVNSVGLRDRALATSRRIRNRRIAAATTAVALVGAALGTAALRTRHTPTPTPMPAVVAPTVLPDEKPEPTPGLGPSHRRRSTCRVGVRRPAPASPAT